MPADIEDAPNTKKARVAAKKEAKAAAVKAKDAFRAARNARKAAEKQAKKEEKQMTRKWSPRAHLGRWTWAGCSPCGSLGHVCVSRMRRAMRAR